MKKRILSLLCVLALCLGLLPATALAAAEGEPYTLYVGDQNVRRGEDTTYWTTDASGGLIRLIDATDDSADWSVKYDPNSATLTLKNATIKTTHNDSRGAVIYAESRSSSAVSLTIQLEGENTIVCDSALYGIYVNAEMSYDSYGTDASLTITGEGSLDVSGSSDGIYIKSGTSNASLTINDASVVASSSSSYGHAGVYVMSSIYATGSPELSLAVNGGSLTTSASEGNDGIQFYVGSSEATGATTRLTISDNAIVRAENGITASRVDKPTPSGTGIVFDGTEGTVYGDVTLDESLTIDQGETLTIPQGSTLNGNSNLTNDGTVTIQEGGTLTGGDAINNTGTINVENGGNLEGTPTTGTVVYAPTITTENPLSEGTVGTEYNQPLAADNGPTQWTVTSGTLPVGLTLNSDGTITGIPTAAGSSTFTVTAENSAGSDSKEYTLNIKAVSVTGVTLDPTELSLFTGESQTLTATVAPNNATNKNVTWGSSNPDVATVVDGKVTAVKAGKAIITVTTAEGNYTATCTVTVTDKTYTITVDPAKLDFDAAYLGYKTQPAPQTVTITNTGNQQVTVTLPTAKDFVIMAGDGFANGRATIEPGKTATFTVQPKAGLAVGSYKESINISGSNGNHTVSTSVEATFAVVDINDTSVDNKLTVTSGISDGISGTAFDTADEVKAELTRVLVQDAAYTAGNTAFYDVKLQYSLDGGNTWFEATEATFPTEGITVTLPYPSGTDKNNYDYRVVHMFTVTSTRLGTEAGKTETPLVTKTDSGLQVTLRGLSPVVIGWDKIETPSSGGSTTPAATATPAPSDNITYYTCPSCGYHNWTATEAGYRCDNCGYLESTRQLSGYGNVKGTYTPGSGATSTAASAVPQTGDESNPVLWTVLLLVSGLALGGLAIAKRKKQQ